MNFFLFFLRFFCFPPPAPAGASCASVLCFRLLALCCGGTTASPSSSLSAGTGCAQPELAHFFPALVFGAASAGTSAASAVDGDGDGDGDAARAPGGGTAAPPASMFVKKPLRWTSPSPCPPLTLNLTGTPPKQMFTLDWREVAGVPLPSRHRMVEVLPEKVSRDHKI